MTNELLYKLTSIDWDFKDAWTQEGIHSLHWYPGTFVPQIANNLIRILTAKGDTILDPFCGCGTSLVESIKLNRNAIGLDCNPIGILISKVKCSKLSPRSLNHKLASIYEMAADSLFQKTQSSIDYKTNSPLLNWFAPNTLRYLFKLWDAINKLTKEEEKDFFQVCLSHVLKTNSSQDKHWGWVADNVTPKKLKEKDIIKSFDQHSSKMIESFNLFYKQVNVSSKSVVSTHNCCLPINIRQKVDAVITSPPYPSVIDYTKAHRLSYYLFEWDIEKDRQIEIGARWKRTRKEQIEEYKKDILTAFENINNVLKRNGLLGIVMDATKRKRTVLADATYIDVAELLVKQFGYKNISGYLKRQLSDQRLLDGHGRKNSEYIVVLQKN
ncbi:MAG: hypothetical protein A2Y10_08750 [Planctomycetes bacterium GWF2_41_51]|nr:MAG: hypothetical protein A2Y10_08750 [Planctomycetes bacterium GWF2_41_51]